MNKVRQWSMLTAAAVVVIMAAGWFLLVSKQNSHAAQLRSQAASVEGSNSSLQTQVAQLQQQKKGLPAQQRLLAKFGTQIPDNPELPTLIRQLSKAADDAGVDLVSLAPAQPAPVAATATTTTTTAPAAPLDQISVSVNVKGSYYNVESFFASMEKLTRAIRVTQFSETPVNEGGDAATTSGSSTSSGSGSTGAPVDPPGTMNVTLTALVFESPTVTPAAPAPAN
jgi:Tfp pilus assembly protein PilO